MKSESIQSTEKGFDPLFNIAMQFVRIAPGNPDAVSVVAAIVIIGFDPRSILLDGGNEYLGGLNRHNGIIKSMCAENRRTLFCQEIRRRDGIQIRLGRRMPEELCVTTRSDFPIRPGIVDSGDGYDPGDPFRRKTEPGHQRQMPSDGGPDHKKPSPLKTAEFWPIRIQKEIRGLQTVIPAGGPRRNGRKAVGKRPASSMVMVDRGEIFSKGKMATK